MRIRHPEPNGSRRATPTNLFQHRAGHPPYALANEARLQWRRLHAKGLIQERSSNGGLWHGERNIVYGIELIRVSSTHGLHVASWIRLQRFSEMMSLFEEILCLRLDEQLTLYLAGKRSAEPLEDIAAKINRFNSQHEIGGCHFSSGPGLKAMPLGKTMFRGDRLPE